MVEQTTPSVECGWGWCTLTGNKFFTPGKLTRDRSGWGSSRVQKKKKFVDLVIGAKVQQCLKR